jgi:hypothetical protein
MRHDLSVTTVLVALLYSLFRLRYLFPRTDVSDVMVTVLFVRCFVLAVVRFEIFAKTSKQENH